MIDTREELLIVLSEAAELEHNLACLYLFAAFSMKQRLNEGLTDLQRGMVTEWRRQILRVAREEMEHLATVHNLLTAIGGAPHFVRPNFPQPALFYPPRIPFTLEKFSKQSVARFVEFERKEDAPGAEAAIAPQLPDYQHVGELYEQIREGFQAVDPTALFVGPVTAQDDLPWGMNVDPEAVYDRASAIRAITAIIDEGEGTTTAGPESHYQIFRRIHAELKEQTKADPAFEPARPVISDPLTRRHRDSLGDTLITDPYTVSVSELFNVIYETMLLGLSQYYAFSSETPAQRNVLRQQLLIPMMIAVVRPLGGMLTDLPMGPEHPGLNAGPSFEIYGNIALSATPRIAWTILIERLGIQAAQANELAEGSADPRLNNVANGLNQMREALAREMPIS